MKTLFLGWGEGVKISFQQYGVRKLCEHASKYGNSEIQKKMDVKSFFFA